MVRGALVLVQSGGDNIWLNNMKQDIHPNYTEVTASCSCGATHALSSTLGKDFHIDVCALCHPFYTGKQKQAEEGGRIDRFRKRFGSRSTVK